MSIKGLLTAWRFPPEMLQKIEIKGKQTITTFIILYPLKAQTAFKQQPKEKKKKIFFYSQHN